MYGRCGLDSLNKALIIVFLFLELIAGFFSLWYVRFIPYLLFFYVAFRFFSKNVNKRSVENDRFMRGWGPIADRVQTRVRQMRDPYYKYYRCSKCGVLQRVPKGRGNIKITCPKCKKVIVRKT